MSDEFYGFDDEDFDCDDGEEEDDDCGAMRDMNHRMVGCQKAGSEECDFECPYRETVERSLRAQDGWAKRKAREKADSQKEAAK